MNPVSKLKEAQAKGPTKTIDSHTHTGFNKALAVAITRAVGSMWTAYIFCLLALASLPAVLTAGNFVPANFFPKWLVAISLIALVSWIAQTFLQLVLLPVIMVGQNVQNAAADSRSEASYEILGHEADILGELHDMQIIQTEILKILDPREKESKNNEPASSVHTGDDSNDSQPTSSQIR